MKLFFGSPFLNLGSLKKKKKKKKKTLFSKKTSL